jgi:hypothetical protein
MYPMMVSTIPPNENSLHPNPEINATANVITEDTTRIILATENNL